MSLKKELTLKDIILITINSIVGAGIFFIPEETAKYGLISILAWILMGFFSIVMSLIIADLVYKYPNAGGPYEFVKRAFNSKFLGFLTAWLEIIASLLIVAMTLTALSMDFQYLTSLPKHVFILLIIIPLTYLAYRGIKTSKYTLIIFAGITIITLIYALIAGAILYSSYFDTIIKKLKIGMLTVPIFLTILFKVFEAYAEWEGITHLAEETKKKEDVAYGLIIGNLVIVIIYFILAFLLTVLYGTINILETTLGKILIILILIQALGTIFSWLVFIPRLLFALGRDEVIPYIFARLHPKYRTPYVSIIFVSVLILFFSLTGTFSLTLETLVYTLLINYILIVLGYIKLKLKDEKGFIPKKLGLLLGFTALIVLFILASIKLEYLPLIFVFIVLGITFYLTYLIRAHYKLIEFVHGKTSFILDILSHFWMKDKYINDIILYISPLENKKILDFGCGPGKLSIEIAKRCKNCIVFASDISPEMLRRVREKVEKEGIHNIILILEKKDRINPHFKEYFDAIVSIGVLGYIINPEIFLENLSRALKKKGKFMFIEFDNVFKIFRAPKWIFNKELWEKYGLKVEYLKEKELFWDVIYVYGEKV